MMWLALKWSQMWKPINYVFFHKHWECSYIFMWLWLQLMIILLIFCLNNYHLVSKLSEDFLKLLSNKWFKLYIHFKGNNHSLAYSNFKDANLLLKCVRHTYFWLQLQVHDFLWYQIHHIFLEWCFWHSEVCNYWWTDLNRAQLTTDYPHAELQHWDKEMNKDSYLFSWTVFY